MATEQAPLASTLAALQTKVGATVRNIVLLDLRLLRGLSNIPVPSKRKLDSTLTQSINVTTFRGEEIPEAPSHMAKTFVQIGFALVGNYEDGSEGLRVEATFGLLYAVDWKDEPTQEVVDEFGRAVGVNNAWPYWREFVQSMTARMGLPPVRIPILRMDQLTFTRSQQTKENAIVAVSKPKKKIAPKSVKKR